MVAIIALLLLAGAPGPAAVPRAVDAHGLRFDSPSVLDLASRTKRSAVPVAVATTGMSVGEVAKILAAPAISEDPPLLRFADEIYGCAKPSLSCSRQHERVLANATRGAVRREGKHLTIVPMRGMPVTFVDWIEPATRSADADEEGHWYLGRLPGSAYERVEVQFAHDAPGSFLVNPQNGKVAFVHNGADLVAPSPDGRLLLTWNSLNPPLSLRVAALDEAGPRLVVSCAAPDRGDRLTPVFKGWRDAATFDFVVETGEPTRRLAAELMRTGSQWVLRASDTARLERIGLGCTADGTSS